MQSVELRDRFDESQQWFLSNQLNEFAKLLRKNAEHVKVLLPNVYESVTSCVQDNLTFILLTTMDFSFMLNETEKAMMDELLPNLLGNSCFNKVPANFSPSRLVNVV